MWSFVSFGASGCDEPEPTTTRRFASTPFFVRYSAIDCARCVESFVLSKPLSSPALSVLPSMRSFVISALSLKIVATCVKTFLDLSFITIFELPLVYSMSPGMSILLADFICTPLSVITFLGGGGGGGGASTAVLAGGGGSGGGGGGGGVVPPTFASAPTGHPVVAAPAKPSAVTASRGRNTLRNLMKSSFNEERILTPALHLRELTPVPGTNRGGD